MECQYCQKPYPKNIPGLYYMEIWFKMYCQNCETISSEDTCPSCAEKNDLCRTFNRDYKIEQIIS
jgi:hypothetical protein